jgi:hypothetical protein
MMVTLLTASMLSIPPLVGHFETPVERFIQAIMYAGVITSLFFWHCPRRESIQSKMDSWIVKSGFIFIFVYTILFRGISRKRRNVALFFTVCGLVAWYRSHANSRGEQWCSDAHLNAHALVHLFGILTLFIIFYRLE